MSAQAEFPMAVKGPKSLTLAQIEALIATGVEELRGDPALGPGYAALCATVTAEHRRAALAAIYTIAKPGQQRLIRTLRALAQLHAEALAAQAPEAVQGPCTTVAPSLPEIVDAQRPLEAFQP